jgi:hypothetical protein
MNKECDKCGMRFERSALEAVRGELWCTFCVWESDHTEPPQRDTWPSPAPTDVTP